MKLTGSVRVSALGLLVLLAITTIALVRRADVAATSFATYAAGDSSSSSSSSGVRCPAELATCELDSTCARCILSRAQRAARTCPGTYCCTPTVGRLRCRAELRDDDIFGATATSCSNNMEVVCCLDKVAKAGCQGNDEYAEYFLCIKEAAGCTDGDVTCSGAHSSLAGA